MFKRNKPEFLRWYIILDETWIHHFTSESTRQSAEWWVTDESRPKRPKMQQSAGKVMALFTMHEETLIPDKRFYDNLTRYFVSNQ